jgi:hypothetical protein
VGFKKGRQLYRKLFHALVFSDARGDAFSSAEPFPDSGETKEVTERTEVA